jgi:uncharacterized protein YjiS (DUF1127 family)
MNGNQEYQSGLIPENARQKVLRSRTNSLLASFICNLVRYRRNRNSLKLLNPRTEF